MPASYQFLDTDGLTVITTLAFGKVPSPGSTANKKLFVKNIGDQTADSTVVSIVQVGTSDGYTFAQIASDSGGVPGSFGTANLSMGNLAVGASVAFWVREVLGAGVTPDNNSRIHNLHAAGFTI